jgi:hypothetical protein
MNIVTKKIQFVIVASVICSFAAFSQTSNDKQQTYQMREKQVTVQQKEVQQTSPASYVNEDDIYQGRQKEILNNLTVRVIPDDFPKYQKGKGIKWYNEQMDNYYRTHPMIITELVRKKLLGN